MPMQRRLPKRGFKNPFRDEVVRGQRRRRSRALRRRRDGRRRRRCSERGMVPRRVDARQDPRRRRADQEAHGQGALRSRRARKEKIEKAGGNGRVLVAAAQAAAAAAETQGAPMASRGFANIGKIPELRRRILFTLALLAVYRIGVFVTTPGVDRDVMAHDRDQAVGDASSACSTCSRAARSSSCRSSRSASCRTSARRSSCSCCTVVVPSSSSSQKEGRAGPAEDQPVHPLRHARPVAGPVVRHRALARGQQPRRRAVRPGRHRPGLGLPAA